MDFNQFQVIELCDLKLPEIPKRSRLYNLKILGLGTPHNESLTSYITRLAEAHCVPTKILLLSEILPLVKKNYVFDDDKHYDLSKISLCTGIKSRALNEIGLNASLFVKALEHLTKQNNLHFLTMLPYAQALDPKDLLRPFKAWCPLCYQEWLMSGHIVYEPLIWCLNIVNICIQHEERLQTQCPYCYRQNPFIESYSQPGYCSKCRKWLGSCKLKQKIESETFTAEKFKQELWIAKSIADLIAAAPSASHLSHNENLKKFMVDCINQATQGNVTDFARLIGKPPTTVHTWYTGKQRPKLRTILEICYYFKIPITNIFSGKFNDNEFNLKATSYFLEKSINAKVLYNKSITLQQIEQELINAISGYPPTSIKSICNKLGLKGTYQFYRHFPELSRCISSRYKEYSNNILKIKLIEELNNQESCPKSLREISRILGVNHTTLSKNFPDLCKLIVEKRTSYLHVNASKRKEEIEQEVREAILTLHSQGIRPDQRKVQELLKRPVVILDKIAQSTLKETLRSLGYLT
jgi:DNA-binding XRE family transcriptional regulator/DNA-binding transcriptional regulator YhcF (GntR family)